jgi:TonB family protein
VTDRECRRVAIVFSLFAHFLLLNVSFVEEEPVYEVSNLVQMDLDSVAVVSPSAEPGTGIVAATNREVRDARAADRKRQIFFNYLDAIDEAVHARRLDAGDTSLLGVATYSFTVRADGSFADIQLRASSGDPRLDASARRAILAASGKVRRPAVIGTSPIPIILQVKYQYGLR